MVCQSCGACCAAFRVSFYWAEADPAQGGLVPPELTEEATPFRRCMRGTNRPQPHCLALQGPVGGLTTCIIYDRRPSTPHWVQGPASGRGPELFRRDRRCLTRAAVLSTSKPPTSPRI